MSNFKSQAKRKRELAKLDKRQAKDQKRALRKAERSGEAPAPEVAVAPKPVHQPSNPTPTAARKPLTLAEAVERWKSSKVAKPNKR
ncbi:MAG TPA: hypothetical protein VM692_01690 [Gammaproteobacteria bacterium]|nr:hypothetical protein [Gammaproteobacteria bacterium]